LIARFRSSLGIGQDADWVEWLIRLLILPSSPVRKNPFDLFLEGACHHARVRFCHGLGLQSSAPWSAALSAVLLLPRTETSTPLHRLRDSRGRSRSVEFWDKPFSLMERLSSELSPRLAPLILVVAILMLMASSTVPLDLPGQSLLFLLTFVVASTIRKMPGSLASAPLVVLALLATFRYAIWRTFQTLEVYGTANQVFSLLLYGAELYTWLVSILSYLQTIGPLHRPPLPLPEDPAKWPSVDIFIPTYNEPLDIVRVTTFAASTIDWPKDRLKVYILDDGRREEFRLFAEKAGVGYITRNSNAHAKAGNLNHALGMTQGEFIAIFDCDHVPVRSFLQMTMGWFIRDPKIALVQTPHHFFSADPFERNLTTFRKVPNESFLFNRVIQDGNDLWNAAFFCGSCAVLRREPLLSIGGVAVETVTEDAHTALKLHRKGLRSAYINIPLAAGLATESLSGHIGQRIRWARGMTQIFRIDNPFLGKGLTWAQRLCYANASMHFFFGVPRLIFLLAPLGYLFFELHFIRAEPIVLLMYGLPYIVLSNIANHHLHGQYRHSFWADVYETVLASYITLPTLLAVISPRLGSFNVTPKGGMNKDEHIDWRINIPYFLLLALNTVGLVLGFFRLQWWNTHEYQAVLMNLFWASYNLIVLGVAFSVGTELRQVRHSHRTAANLKAILYLPNEQVIATHTLDFSFDGLALSVPDVVEPSVGDVLSVGLYRGSHEYTFQGRVTALSENRLGLKMEFQNIEEESLFVSCTYSRADAWSKWHHEFEPRGILESIRELFAQSARGYRRLVRHSIQQLVAVLR
jgi:cellulose synthase (UDP-forming)